MIDKDLLMSKLDEHVSFSLAINLIKNPKSRFVVFKPTITFTSAKKNNIEELLEFFEVKVKDIPQYKQMFSVRLQRFVDILQVLDKIEMKDFSYDSRYHNIKVFEVIYHKVIALGHVHKQWDDKFLELLDLKEKLNVDTRTRRGYSKKQWAKRINNHFYEIED